MTSIARRPWMIGATVVVLAALGLGVAVVVGDELGIRSEASVVPAEPQHPLTVGAAIAAPTFVSVDAPQSLRMDAAVQELRDAGAESGTPSGEATLTVSFGDGDTGAKPDDTYRLEGEPGALHIIGNGEAGAVRGVYDIAAAVRDGRSVSEALGTTVTSKLGLRMVDLGAVGVDPDPAQWQDGTDYSHASKAFVDVILPAAPYIDQDALATARADFEAYVRHSLAEGYNAIAVPGFVEYLTFAGVDGVYADGDMHIDRALAMQQAFGPLWEYADAMGMRVYMRTDMLTLTSPLEDYLTGRFGSLDTANSELWDVYAKGADELYEAMPWIDGILIRIGEAGRVYDVEGWDVYSALAVTTVDAVRTMLTTLTAQAEASGKELIFRTWSVGVGAVGDMHTNPDSYEAVLGGIDSPALIVSTKYTLGDFYSHLPFNTTLEQGTQRRIIEFQSRREFENFGAFPNDLGVLYQEALQTFLATNDNIEGIWTWTQDGGPWRAGPMTLTLKAGFWQLYELNTELAVRLARNPDLDPASITVDWARRWFSTDQATVQAIVDAMALSREAITDGLYIGPFADKRVFAIGLEPPPMMWIFEWDILTGDSAVLDVIYSIARDDLDEAIAGGTRAVDAATQMQALVSDTYEGNWRDNTLHASFVDTLNYEVNTLEMLSAYRELVLRQGQWHDTLSPEAYTEWAGARDRFVDASAAHVAAYDGNVDYPAYNLTAAQLGVDRADRDLAMAWAARVLLLIALLWVVWGMFSARTRVVSWPGAGAARAAWLAGTRPWRAYESTLGLQRIDRLLLVVVPGALLVLSRGIQTSFLAPVHLLVTLGSWLLFCLVLSVALRRRSPWPVISAVGGAIVLRVVVLLVALAPSGPGGYWFGFWTDPVRRTVYITVAFALFIWVLVAAGWSLSGQLGVRRAWGVVLAGVGTVLAVIGTCIGIVGLEAALTVWNDQMGLLPWGLARILGITVYLDIPVDTAWFAALAGAVLLVVGVLMARRKRRRVAQVGVDA